MDGKTILPRSEVPEEFTWDLSHVFASDDKWNEELEALKAYPERMAAYAGKLGEGAKTLLAWFTLSDEINVRVSKFVQYASCRSDQRGQLVLSGDAQQGVFHGGRAEQRGLF